MSDRNRQQTDALYADRVRLLKTDPDRYLREYPKPTFGFRMAPDSGDKDGDK